MAVAAAEVWISSEGTSSSAARMSWRMESMPVVRLRTLPWSVAIFSIYDMVFLCFYRSHEDVLRCWGEVATLGRKGGGKGSFSGSNDAGRSTALPTGHRNPAYQ